MGASQSILPEPTVKAEIRDNFTECCDNMTCSCNSKCCQFLLKKPKPKLKPPANI